MKKNAMSHLTLQLGEALQPDDAFSDSILGEAVPYFDFSLPGALVDIPREISEHLTGLAITPSAADHALFGAPWNMGRRWSASSTESTTGYTSNDDETDSKYATTPQGKDCMGGLQDEASQADPTNMPNKDGAQSFDVMKILKMKKLMPRHRPPGKFPLCIEGRCEHRQHWQHVRGRRSYHFYTCNQCGLSWCSPDPAMADGATPCTPLSVAGDSEPRTRGNSLADITDVGHIQYPAIGKTSVPTTPNSQTKAQTTATPDMAAESSLYSSSTFTPMHQHRQSSFRSTPTSANHRSHQVSDARLFGTVQAEHSPTDKGVRPAPDYKGKYTQPRMDQGMTPPYSPLPSSGILNYPPHHTPTHGWQPLHSSNGASGLVWSSPPKGVHNAFTRSEGWPPHSPSPRPSASAAFEGNGPRSLLTGIPLPLFGAIPPQQ